MPLILPLFARQGSSTQPALGSLKGSHGHSLVSSLLGQVLERVEYVFH